MIVTGDELERALCSRAIGEDLIIKGYDPADNFDLLYYLGMPWLRPLVSQEGAEKK